MFGCDLPRSFNSNMVRLKVAFTELIRTTYISFNSNMVRLKAFGVFKLVALYSVSIPIWFD